MPEVRVPLWSVVIPLYNKAPYIEATLRSVLQQSVCDFEIIVVDDGSTDSSPEIAMALADPRIRVFRQANAGVAAARNLGISRCRGEFVVFLDADDLHHPQMLECMSGLRRQFPHARALGTAYLRVPHHAMEGYRFATKQNLPTGRLIFNLPAEFRRVGMPFFTSSIAVARDLLDCMEIWFPVGESLGEDLDLWFRVVEQTPVAYADEAFAIYRVGMADSLTGSQPVNVLLPVWQRMEARAQQGQMSAVLRAASLRLVAEMRVTLARVKLKQGERCEGLQQLLRAWRGMRGHRWWVTLLAACTGSSRVLRAMR